MPRYARFGKKLFLEFKLFTPVKAEYMPKYLRADEFYFHLQFHHNFQISHTLGIDLFLMLQFQEFWLFNLTFFKYHNMNLDEF